MAQPTQTDVHVDVALTNISVAYIQGQDVFNAAKIFPVVPVEKQSDKYFIYTKNDWFRDEAQKRADSTESSGSGYNLSTTTYNCDVFAHHKDVGDQAQSNADSQINLERDATQFVTGRLLLRQEVQWAADYFATSKWATDVTPSNLWDNYVTSDPLNDVETGKRAILAVTGFRPNTLVLGYDVFRYLKNHPDIVDRIKYTSADVVTPQLLARLFGVDNVRVMEAVYATNLENETAAYNFVMGSKHALLCYSAPNPGLLVPSAGYTFVWSGVSDGFGTNVGVTRIPIPLKGKKTYRVEAEMAWTNKLIATDLGYFFNGAVS